MYDVAMFVCMYERLYVCMKDCIHISCMYEGEHFNLKVTTLHSSILYFIHESSKDFN